MTYAWIPKKLWNTSEQPACHDLLIMLRYAMKSRVICGTGCLIGIVYTFSLLYLFYATAVVPPKYGHALNCQNLYVEMGSKVLYYPNLQQAAQRISQMISRSREERAFSTTQHQLVPDPVPQ